MKSLRWIACLFLLACVLASLGCPGGTNTNNTNNANTNTNNTNRGGSGPTPM